LTRNFKVNLCIIMYNNINIKILKLYVGLIKNSLFFSWITKAYPFWSACFHSIFDSAIRMIWTKSLSHHSSIFWITKKIYYFLLSQSLDIFSKILTCSWWVWIEADLLTFELPFFWLKNIHWIKTKFYWKYSTAPLIFMLDFSINFANPLIFLYDLFESLNIIWAFCFFIIPWVDTSVFYH